MKKSIILILASFTVLTMMTACSEKTKTTDSIELQEITMVLDFTPNTNHTGIFVADKLGYFEEAGLDVEIIQPPDGGAETLVATGKAQFGIGFQESHATALTLENPLPITAIATIINHNTSGIVSHKDSNIMSFKDLEGKTYSTWSLPVEQAILTEVMQAEGADYEKVNAVPAGAVDALSAIQTDIDAIWVYEAWDVVAIEQAEIPYNFIRFSDVSPVLDFFTPIIIGNNEFLETNPDTTKAFLSAVSKGYEYAINNPAESAKILVEASPELDIDMVTASQEFLANEYKAESDKWGYIDETRWTEFYDWCFEKNLIPKEIGANGFTNEFLPSN